MPGGSPEDAAAIAARWQYPAQGSHEEQLAFKREAADSLSPRMRDAAMAQVEALPSTEELAALTAQAIALQEVTARVTEQRFEGRFDPVRNRLRPCGTLSTGALDRDGRGMEHRRGVPRRGRDRGQSGGRAKRGRGSVMIDPDRMLHRVEPHHRPHIPDRRRRMNALPC
ncbi:hypothetical protein [Glycomyces sp. YM15]|uniref:hypothetical protein n=1 Tax=Glycomyces sp. YM15 TaxID=2800446 RepID=UPI00196434BE|nr:hypothetical protein [Glycomyces sp. YM15]